MDFMHNPIADMYGPTFLWVYGGVTLIALTLCWGYVRWRSAGAGGPPPPLPKDPNPLELAYLRGGATEAIRLITFDLTRRGLIEFDPASSSSELKAVELEDRQADVSDIEAIVLRAFRARRRVETPLRNEGVVAAVDRHFDDVKRRFEREGLLADAGAAFSAYTARVVGTLIIVGLGGYKLIVALLKGRTNVGFLILIGVAGVMALYFLCRPRRLTSKARAYLERLQAAFRPPPIGTSWRSAARGSTSASALPAAFSTTPPDDSESLLPLFVGLHGLHVLNGTAFGYFPIMFAQAPPATPGTSWLASGCGSVTSCGAASSGGGSSCGSSCGGGGGGCGGGGCGGCGGGS